MLSKEVDFKNEKEIKSFCAGVMGEHKAVELVMNCPDIKSDNFAFRLVFEPGGVCETLLIEDGKIRYPLPSSITSLGTTKMTLEAHKGNERIYKSPIVTLSFLSSAQAEDPVESEKLSYRNEITALTAKANRALIVAEETQKNAQTAVLNANNSSEKANEAALKASAATAKAESASSKAENNASLAQTASKNADLATKAAKDASDIALDVIEKTKSAAAHSYNILPYQIKDSKSIIWLDDRFKHKGYIESNGVINSSKVNSSYVKINVSGKSKCVFISKSNVKLSVFWIQKNDNTLEKLVVSSKNRPIPWLNLVVFDLPLNSNYVSFNLNNQNSNMDFGIAYSFLEMMSYIYNGYSVFMNERDKANVTEYDNIYKGVNIKEYFINTVGDLLQKFDENCTITPVFCKANTLYYIGHPYIDVSLYTHFISIDEDANFTKIDASVDLERGYTVLYKENEFKTFKFISSKDCILLFNTGITIKQWRDSVVVSTVLDKDKYKINDSVTRINGCTIRDINQEEVVLPKYDVKNILKSKNITVIGDSITEHNYRAAKNWVDFLSEWTGAKVQNLGVSGTGFARGNNYIQRIDSIHSNVDIIGVAMTWNDLMTSPPLGSVGDTGTVSVMGYINDLFDALITRFPTVPIICYCQGPWEHNRKGVEKCDVMIDSVAKLCSLKGIPFYGDLFNHGCALRPWIEANRVKYYKSEQTGVVDNVHPNSEGHKIIARYLIPKFEENIVSTGLTYNIGVEAIA